jgi:hypothetical protein
MQVKAPVLLDMTVQTVPPPDHATLIVDPCAKPDPEKVRLAPTEAAIGATLNGSGANTVREVLALFGVLSVAVKRYDPGVVPIGIWYWQVVDPKPLVLGEQAVTRPFCQVTVVAWLAPKPVSPNVTQLPGRTEVRDADR